MLYVTPDYIADVSNQVAAMTLPLLGCISAKHTSRESWQQIRQREEFTWTKVTCWIGLDSVLSLASIDWGPKDWNEAARLGFQMHTACRFQNGGLGPHFFEHRNRIILRPLIAPYLKKASVFSALLFLRHTIDKIIFQFCCCFWSVNVAVNFFVFIEYQQMSVWLIRSIIWFVSTTLSEWCSLAFSLFFVFHCQTFDSSYCSGNLSQARSRFFEVMIARADGNDICLRLPSHFSDILDARKQIQIKSLSKVDRHSGRHLLLKSWDYPFLCYSRWFHTRQQPNQMRYFR